MQLVTTSFAAGSVIEGRAGIGRNVWTLHPDQITEFLQVFYIFEVLYSFVLAIIKISICCLYLRVFPGHRFRVIVWATQAFNIGILVTFFIADMLQCRPLNFFWLGWDGEHQGVCWDLNALGWAHASINIGLDLWMLALPASQIWSLNMPLRQKARVLAMFSFGILYALAPMPFLNSLVTSRLTYGAQLNDNQHYSFEEF